MHFKKIDTNLKILITQVDELTRQLVFYQKNCFYKIKPTIIKGTIRKFCLIIFKTTRVRKLVKC